MAPPTEIDTSFDVPLDGQKVLMTPATEVDDSFDVPLDGAKVIMSPSADHGNETTDDEDSDDDDDESQAHSVGGRASYVQHEAPDHFC